MLSACQLMVILEVQMLWPHLDVIHILLFIFNNFIISFLRTYVCKDIMVLRLLFIYFQFLDGVQNSIPKVWQVVLSNISI